MNLDKYVSTEDIDNIPIDAYIENLLTATLIYPAYERSRSQMRGAELAHACMRINTLRLSELNSSETVGFPVITAEAGKAIEKLIRDNLIKEHPDKLLLYDAWLPKINKMGLSYSGKLDLLLDIPGYGMTVVDIKTTTRLSDEKRVSLDEVEEAILDNNHIDDILDSLKTVKKGTRKSSATWDKWLYQLIGYATFLDITHTAIFAISRSKENFNEPVTVMTKYFDVTDEQKYDTITKMLLAHRLHDQLAIPAKPPKFKKTVHCKYCDFFKMCWEGQKHNNLELTQQQTSELYHEIYPEAVELYDKYRAKLAWVRDKMINETQK